MNIKEYEQIEHFLDKIIRRSHLKSKSEIVTGHYSLIEIAKKQVTKKIKDYIKTIWENQKAKKKT